MVTVGADARVVERRLAAGRLSRRTVRKTATVSLHGNTYQVNPSLAGRKVG